MILEILWITLGVLALVGLNGVYVGTEFALIGSRRSKLEMLVHEGNLTARRVLDLLRDLPSLDRAIATIQVGITVASLALGMYGEHAVAKMLEPALEPLGSAAGVAAHGLASVVAIGLMTFLHVVLGEVVPKSIALLNPARAALWLYPVLQFSKMIATPFVLSLAGVSRAILGALRVRAISEEERAHSLEEIETVIEESGEGGLLETRHADILVNLLYFEELPVRKAMVPRNRVAGLPAGATREEALALIQATQHSRYPVHGRDLDDVLGYVHAKDVLRAQAGAEPLDLCALARPVIHVPETAPATRLLRSFRKQRTHMAVVLDEHGGTAGIIMPDDLIEEIFGEVQDEFDAEEPGVRPLGPNAARVRGDVRLDDLNEELGLDLHQPYVDTLGGLVMARLGRLAAAGDTLTVGRVTLDVERVTGHAVRTVRVTWAPRGGRR